MASGIVKFRVKRATGISYNLLTALDVTTANIITKDLDLGDPATSKLVQRLFFEIVNRGQATGLQLYIEYRNALGDPFQSVGPIQLGGTVGAVTVRVPAAKYFRVKLEDISVRALWKLAAFEVWGEATSMRAA